MARKKPDMTNIFARTEPEGESTRAGDNEDLDSGRITTQGVGLREGELAALNDLANRSGLTKNALARLAIRKFIIDERTGALDLSDYIEAPEPKKRAKLPK